MALDLTKALVLYPERRVSLEDVGIMLAPQQFIPRGATVVDQTVSPVVAPGIPGLPNTVIAFSYLVPPFRRGVFRRLAVSPVDPSGIPSITFSVLRSGTPVGNFQNVQTPIGTVNAPDDIFLEYDRQQLLQVAVSNFNIAFSYEVHVRIVAWFWDVIQLSGR